MMKRVTERFAAWCKACPKLRAEYGGRGERGFLLLEYVFSLAVGALLAALVCNGLQRAAASRQYLQEQLQLQQAGSYMQGLLEKNLAYNATAITINKQGNLEMDTIFGNKKLLIYTNNQGLYLRTTTKTGSGSNPLFLPDYPVTDWQAQRLSDSALRISFHLQGRRSQATFSQLISCCNGAISDAQM